MKQAVITGGSGGIGVACAKVLLERGYAVLLTARREGPLKEAAAEVGCDWAVADSTDETSFRAAVGPLERVDLLIHSAGVNDGTFVRKETLERFESVIRTNLTSAFIVTAAVLPKMPAGGRIVFLSSSASRQPMRGLTAYSASKAGLNAFAEALQSEVTRDGILVNTIIPAPVATAMLDRVTFPMHTMQPEDVAETVRYLDSLAPGVIVPEIFMTSVTEGPNAPTPTVPRG